MKQAILHASFSSQLICYFIPLLLNTVTYYHEKFDYGKIMSESYHGSQALLSFRKVYCIFHLEGKKWEVLAEMAGPVQAGVQQQFDFYARMSVKTLKRGIIFCVINYDFSSQYLQSLLPLQFYQRIGPVLTVLTESSWARCRNSYCFSEYMFPKPRLLRQFRALGHW